MLLTNAIMSECEYDVYKHYFDFVHQQYYCYCLLNWREITECILCSLADPGGGGAPGARPPLTAADLWFFIPKTLIFLIFFIARFARDSF